MAKSNGTSRRTTPRENSEREINSQIEELNRANERLFREMDQDPDNREYYESQIDDNDRMIDELESERQRNRTTATSAADSAIKQVQKAAFKEQWSGSGVWDLSTPDADTSIVMSNEPFVGKVYTVSVVGATGKDGNYTTEQPNRRFSSLNAAKAAAREELIKYIRKVN